MNKKVVALPVAGRALIPTPETWTQGAIARDAAGTPCSVYDPKAVCFCSNGAVFRAWYSLGLGVDPRIKANHFLDGAFDGNRVRANDDPRTTHADILAGWDRAIELARAAP